MSLDVDVFGHQFSLDMQDGLPLDVEPLQESEDEVDLEWMVVGQHSCDHTLMISSPSICCMKLCDRLYVSHTLIG